MIRKSLTAAVLLCLGMTCSAGASAQAADAAAFPTKQVRLVVPFAAGGASDIIARLVAQKLGELWGQTMLVDNRGGASGAIGLTFVAKSPADGHTLILGGPATLSGPPALNPKVPYDNLKDFEHVSIVATFPSVLAVNPAVAKTLPELIAVLKANPGKYTYATSGNATSTHLIAELFKWMTGTNIVHVPYKGTAPGITDLIAGQVSMTFAPVNVVMPHVQAKRLNAIGITSAKRSSELPEIPAIAEVVPKFEADSWICISAPAGTPRAIVQKISTDVRRMFRDPETVRKFKELDLTPVGSTPEELVRVVREDTERWRNIGRIANIQME